MSNPVITVEPLTDSEIVSTMEQLQRELVPVDELLNTYPLSRALTEDKTRLEDQLRALEQLP